MKIIAGKYKGRVLKQDNNDNSYRPTKTKAREAIFSILTSGSFIDENSVSVLDGSIVLDLYCGSASLGFEALSRGAKKLIAVDIEQRRINMVKENAIKLNSLEDVILIRADATSMPKANQSCDLIFIDPPYNKNLVFPTIQSLEKEGWLKKSTLLIIESAKKEVIAKLQNFELLDERHYGKSKISFFRFINNLGF